MKFRAVSFVHATNNSEIAALVHELRVLEDQGDHLDLVLRLGTDSIALAYSKESTGRRQTQSMLRSDGLFSEYQIESKRNNKIDLLAKVGDVLDLFELFARHERVIIKLEQGLDSPLLGITIIPRRLPGIMTQECVSKIRVRLLSDVEANAIQDFQVRNSQEVRSEASERMRTMYLDRLFTDACFSLGDQSIPVHRTVIAAASPVLSRMLQSDMQESQTLTIRLPETTEKAATAFISFLYGLSTPDLDAKDLAELFSLGHFYDVASLMNLCKDRMPRYKDADDIVTLIRHMLQFEEDPGTADIVQCLTEVLWQRAAADRSKFFNILAAVLASGLDKDMGKSCPRAKRPRISS